MICAEGSDIPSSGRGPTLSESLDFERSCRSPADLTHEEIEILFDTPQKSPQIRLAADVGRVSGGERWAVIGEAEDAMTAAQQRARKATLFGEGNPLWRQRDTLDKAEAGENSRYVQGFQLLVHGQHIGHRAGRGQQTGVADRERDFEQRLIGSEPIRPGAAMRKIGPEIAAQVGAGNNADIDLVVELGENPCCAVANPVPARLVDPRPHTEIFADDLGQSDQLLALEFVWQVARVGILICCLFDEGRRVPGLEVGTNFADSRAVQFPDELVPIGRAAHRVVEDEGRADAIAFEDPLSLCLALDRCHPDCSAGLRACPVEFSFGVDNDDDHRRMIERPVNHPPCFGIQHSPAITSDGLPMSCGNPLHTGAPRAMKMWRDVMSGPFQHLFGTNVLWKR